LTVRSPPGAVTQVGCRPAAALGRGALAACGRPGGWGPGGDVQTVSAEGLP